MIIKDKDISILLQTLKIELEKGDNTKKAMENNGVVCNSEQVHLKDGVQHTNVVASTYLKDGGTSVIFIDSPVHVNTSMLNVN